MIKMKLGKITGNVVASVKDPGLKGLRLLIVQGLADDFTPVGKPYVAADGIFTAGPGDIVYLVSKKEAAIAISKDKLIPIDECVVGYIDEFNAKKFPKKTVTKAKPATKGTTRAKTVKKTPPSKTSTSAVSGDETLPDETK